TERDSSYHEVVAAAVSGDNSQLKGIYRAPKLRGRKRKAAEDISSQAPASKAAKKPITPKKTVKETAVTAKPIGNRQISKQKAALEVPRRKCPVIWDSSRDEGVEEGTGVGHEGSRRSKRLQPSRT